MTPFRQWPAAAWLAMCMALALVAPPAVQAKQLAVPAFSARLLDLTGTLDEGQKETLREKIAALEENTGAVLAVLMVQTTGEDSIEQYATRVFEQWKLGDAGQDNGLLIIVALKDRRMRIEVGQGLEGVLPDVLAGRIIDLEMKPRFRDEDYAGGIEAAITSLEAVLRGEPEAAAPVEAPRALRDVVRAHAPLLGCLGLTALAGLGLGVMWARRRMPWPLVLALLPAGPVAAGLALGKPAVAAACLAATAAAYGLGFCVVRSQWVRWLVVGVLLLLGTLLGVESAVGADAFWELFPVLVPAGISCLLLVMVGFGMRASWRRSKWEFGARSGLVLAITGYALLENMPDGSLSSWMPTALAAGISLLFCFLVSSIGSRGGSGGYSGGSSGSSSRSSGSSSSSSSGGSSSGGGASGSW